MYGIVSLPACFPSRLTTLKEIPPMKSHGQSPSQRECLDKNSFRWLDMYPATDAPRHFAVLTAGPDLRTLPQIMKTYT